MDLAAQYERQERWRRWDDALARLPIAPGQRVLDLGCGAGAVAARLVARGCDVIAVDANPELIAAARARHPELRCEAGDVRDLERFGAVDGIWSSFVAAYLPDLDDVLRAWRERLLPGGWIALCEIDDLLGHEPLAPSLRAEIRRFYDGARGRYDFERGRRLAPALRQAGFTIDYEGTLADDELAFAGPAADDVIAAWRDRMQRMQGLRRHFGARAGELEAALLAALRAPDHRSLARVVFVVARR